MYRTEFKQIFTILDDLEENLDTPRWYFDVIRSTFKDAFDEAERLNSSILPSLIVSEFVGQMQEYSMIARSEYSSDMFSTLADIAEMVLSNYLGDIFTLEDRYGQICCN